MDCEKVDTGLKDQSDVIQAFCDKGFSESFPVLWNLCDTRLLRFIKGRVKSPDDAEDVRQEVGIKLYRYVPRHLVNMVPPMAFSMAKDEIADYFRRASRSAGTLSLEELLLHHEPEAADGNRRFEQWQRLQHHMRSSGVSRDQQMTVVLRYLLGFTVKEVADILECKPETVKGRLRYAQQKMGSHADGKVTP